MANTSDSQITASVSCLSLPSEPPDVRNWFSSYKYESFVLDTYDDFGGSVFQESNSKGHGCIVFEEKRTEKGANLAESRRNVENENNLEKRFSSKMPDSGESPLLLSGPPYISNWFSSYVYESPSLDTIDDFTSPACKESESKIDGCASDSNGSSKVEEKNFEESSSSGNCNEVAGENQHLCEPAKCESTFGDASGKPLNKIPDFPQISSLLSEPPDIRNWFSSFVYQSPPPCEVDEFLLEKTAREGDSFPNEDSNKKKTTNAEKVGQTRIADTILRDKACFTRFSKLDSPAGDDKEGNKLQNESKKSVWKESLATVKDLHCEREKSLKDKVLPVFSAQDAEKASLNNDGHLCIRKNEQNYPGETGLNLFKDNIKTRITAGTSLRKLVDENDLTDNLNTKSETQVNLQSPVRSMRKSTHGAGDKENKGNDVPGNGFVTTRKSRVLRSNDENFDRTQSVVPGCSGNKGTTSLDGEKDVAIKRKVLSERTNFDPTANTIEITGKWHCPQKNKPSVRPPSKQLRLEQWFHRV